MTSDLGAIPGAIPGALAISGIAIPEMPERGLRNSRNSAENLGFGYSGGAIPKFLAPNKRNSAENLAIPLFPLRADGLSGIARHRRGLAPLFGARH